MQRPACKQYAQKCLDHTIQMAQIRYACVKMFLDICSPANCLDKSLYIFMLRCWNSSSFQTFPSGAWIFVSVLLKPKGKKQPKNSDHLFYAVNTENLFSGHPKITSHVFMFLLSTKGQTNNRLSWRLILH